MYGIGTLQYSVKTVVSGRRCCCCTFFFFLDLIVVSIMSKIPLTSIGGRNLFQNHDTSIQNYLHVKIPLSDQ